MRAVRQILIGVFSVVIVVGGVAVMTPLGKVFFVVDKGGLR